MKITLTVELSVDPLFAREEELTPRQLQNINGAVCRVVRNRLGGLVSVELGAEQELEWATKVTGVTTEVQSKA